jgi:hypothetical protein
VKEVQRYNPGTDCASKWKDGEGMEHPIPREIKQCERSKEESESDTDSDKTVEYTVDDDMTTIDCDDWSRDSVVAVVSIHS